LESRQECQPHKNRQGIVKPTVQPLLQGIRVVVFDAVGTVIHPNPSAPVVYADMGRRFGSQLTVPVISRRFLDAFHDEETLDVRFGFRTSEQRERERWQRIVARVLDDVTDPDACFRELFEHFSLPRAWECDPTALSTFESLANLGFQLALASNYDQRLHSVAAGLPPLRLLEHRVISSEVGWRKPAPEFFETLCRIVDQPADSILHVGDSLTNDYQGARNAGLQAALIRRSAATTDGAVVEIEQLHDLVDLLK
jgi:putative hydrolase of the HAD superfamily